MPFIDKEKEIQMLEDDQISKLERQHFDEMMDGKQFKQKCLKFVDRKHLLEVIDVLTHSKLNVVEQGSGSRSYNLWLIQIVYVIHFKLKFELEQIPQENTVLNNQLKVLYEFYNIWFGSYLLEPGCI